LQAPIQAQGHHAPQPLPVPGQQGPPLFVIAFDNGLKQTLGLARIFAHQKPLTY
jgi:hypothetical protein